MKSIKYIMMIPAIIFVLIASSCKKSFYTDANNNPNAPPNASITPSVLLSSAEGELAYTQGGTFGLFISLFDQQDSGAARQSQAYYQYIVTNQDLDDPWSTWYTDVLASLKDLTTRADAARNNEYSGIARILTAYTLQVMVDAWGNIPYSTANQGPTDLTPTYDLASTLYTTIGSLVSTGIADLNNANPGALVPSGSDDIIYAGSEAEWIKFGHAINARIAIHQSKGNAAMASTALSEISMSFTSNADNAQFIFGSTQNNSGPWYQFNQERGGDVSFTTGFLPRLMQSQADPRYNIFFDSTVVSGNFTDVNEVGMGPYYGNINSPVEFICYDELQFIAAEANARLGSSGQANFTKAIEANMNKLGIDSTQAAPYIAAHGALPGSGMTAIIDSIAQQEYIALYLNPEAWTVWRRTGSPALTPITGSNGIPRRFIYVQTEYFYNAANVNAQGTVTLWSPKIFWDN